MSDHETDHYNIQNILPLSVSLGSLPSTFAGSATEIRGSSNSVRGKYKGSANNIKGNLDKIKGCENDQDGNKSSICSRIHDDKDFFPKLLASISFGGAFCMLGWCKGQIGPSFLDLQFITNTDVEGASGFLTAYYVGRMVGSIVTGAFFHRVNLRLLFIFTTVCNGGIAAVIPWCAIYELMVGAHLIYGLFGGILDAGVTSASVTIWDIRGSRTYLQILNLVFSLSSIVSPVVTAPFLLNQESRDFDETTTHTNISTIYVNITTLLMSTSSAGDTVHESPESQLYMAYIVTAALSCLAGIPFLIMLHKSKSAAKSESTGGSKRLNFHGKLPKFQRIISLINIGLFVFLQCAVDYTFSGFLTLFCVKHLRWSKFNSSFLTSAFFLTNLLGRIFNVFLIQVFSSIKLLGLSVIVTAFGFSGFLVSAQYHHEVGVWISTCVIGLFNAINYPVFLVWTNDTVISISGLVSAYILVTAFIGAVLNPLIISFLMEKYSNMWFCYDSLIGSCLLLLSFIVMLWYTYLMRQYKRKQEFRSRALLDGENIENNSVK